MWWCWTVPFTALGDFDGGIDTEAIRQAQYPIEVIHAPDQEKTDLDKGIEFLIERGFPAVNIVWATGRRIDHTTTNVTNIVRYREQIKITMIDDYSVIYPLVGRYEKWFAKGSPISLIPVGTVEGIRTQGLMYNLDNESLTLGFRTGSSNAAAEDGFVRITAERGALLIMECRDGE
jgi:thiamine pyrophosphokinase